MDLQLTDKVILDFIDMSLNAIKAASTASRPNEPCPTVRPLPAATEGQPSLTPRGRPSPLRRTGRLTGTLDVVAGFNWISLCTD